MLLPLRTRLLPALAALLVSAFLLSGCFLRSLFANVVFVENLIEEVDSIVTAVETNSTVAVCQTSEFFGFGCTYIVSGQIIESTGRLLREFPIAGVLIDPLILQAPADAVEIEATYDAGAGAQPAVVLETDSFEIQPGKVMTAETGTKLLILEFPAAVTAPITGTDPALGPAFDLSLTFTQTRPHADQHPPVTIKALFALKVTVRGHTYYAPVLPCVESMADAPALTIPVADNPVSLAGQVAALLQQEEVEPCFNKLFNYVHVPPPDKRVYLPLVGR